VNVVGVYQRCDQGRCVPDFVAGSESVPYQVLWVERHWVQIAFHEHKFVEWFRKERGAFVADVVRVQRGEGSPRQIYFNLEKFEEVDAMPVERSTRARAH